MKLLLKLNLIDGLAMAMAVGVSLSGWIGRGLLQDQAQQEVLGGAGMLMERAGAVRNSPAG